MTITAHVSVVIIQVDTLMLAGLPHWTGLVLFIYLFSVHFVQITVSNIFKIHLLLLSAFSILIPFPVFNYAYIHSLKEVQNVLLCKLLHLDYNGLCLSTVNHWKIRSQMCSRRDFGKSQKTWL